MPDGKPVQPAENHPAKEDVPPRSAAHEVDRGRQADEPTDVPPKGWKDVLWRTKQQLDEDNLSIVAAGVAFYAFLAVVPALAVAIAIYALVADPANLSEQLNALARVVPGEVMPLLEEQMKRIAENNTAASISAVLGVLIALYSSANATKAIITGLNIAYDETEKRSFIKLNAVALILTLGAIVGVLAAIGIIAVLPAVLDHVLVSSASETALNVLRWPLLLGVFVVGVAVMYRFGPCRDGAQWKWISPGAIVAAILWVVGSGLFSLYVSKFGSYDKTYGSLGAVAVFMMWLYLTAYVVLLGAEMNSELERQTTKDTTKGEPRRIGNRDAYAADTVGPAKDGGS
jgi:membrane protein